MKTIFAISAILILALTALACGEDGVLLAGAMSLIAALGGYAIGKKTKP